MTEKEDSTLDDETEYEEIPNDTYIVENTAENEAVDVEDTDDESDSDNGSDDSNNAGDNGED